MAMNRETVQALLDLHNKRQRAQDKLTQLESVRGGGSISLHANREGFPAGTFVAIDMSDMSPAHQALIVEVCRRALRAEIDGASDRIAFIETHTT